jgi:hypothetical protein
MPRNNEKVDPTIRTRYGSIEEVCERWARWRHYRMGGGLGYPSRTILGKLLDGMPGKKCPTCRGSKRFKCGIIGHVVQYITCPQCSGQGEVKHDADIKKVNPYFIRPTNYEEKPDPVSERMDWLYCTELAELERNIIWAEYVLNGNRNVKIGRLKVTHAYYNATLTQAHQKLADGLKA